MVRRFLVSFDVESLFTRVPIDEALEAIGNALTRDDTLQDRTNMTAATVCELKSSVSGLPTFNTRVSCGNKPKGLLWALPFLQV